MTLPNSKRMAPRLEVSALIARYGDAAPVLKNLSFEAFPGEITLVLGRNGAGKTTLLRTLSGLHRPDSGVVKLNGTSIGGKRPERIAKLGMGHVPEGRRLITAMSVLDNLRVGGWTLSGRDALKKGLQGVYDILPALRDWSERRAGSLSGGQQQLVSIGRALMSSPEVLLLDEPLTGLDPIFQEQVMVGLDRICQRGIAVVLVEQNTAKSVERASAIHLLDLGRFIHEDSPTNVSDEQVRRVLMSGRSGDLLVPTSQIDHDE